MTQNTVQNLESPGLSGRVDSTTSFPGFSPTRPTERETERGSLSLSRSVGRVGENPGNEVVDGTACPSYKRWQNQPTTSTFTSLKHSRRPCAPSTAKQSIFLRIQVRASSQTKGLERGWKQWPRLGRDAKVFFPLASYAHRACDACVLRACKTLPISLLILRKKPTVLQSMCT